MIAHWMAYAVGVGLLCGGAALLLERVLRLHTRPARGVWAAAMAGSVVAPALVLMWLALRPAADAPLDWAMSSVGAGAVLGAVQSSASAAPVPRLAPWWLGTDGVLLLAWAVGSLALMAVLAWGCVRLARQRRTWAWATAAGAAVLVSARTGPAVVGLWRPVIVVPEWVLKCGAEHQRLIVEHEREHIRAGDPRLLFGALLLVALVPWNLPLWWQAYRLRLAVEMDCDARVLRSRHGTREYARLLLEVGRGTAGGLLPLPAFSEPASFLERRIRQMTARPPRRRGWVTGVLLLGVLTAPLAASTLPVPELPKEMRNAVAALRTSSGGSAATAPDTTRPRLLNPAEVKAGLERSYPRQLRDAGVGGSVLLEAEVDREGRVRNTLIVHMTNDEFAKAASDAIYQARFAPATDSGRAVAYTLPLAVAFRPGRAGSDAVALLVDALPAAVAAERIATVAPVSAALDADSAMDIAATGARPELTNQRAVLRALERNYPQQYQEAGVGGTATIRFVINRQGQVDTSTIVAVQATNPAFAQAAKEAAKEFNFTPVRYRGEPVRVWVSLPVTFTPSTPRPATAPAVGINMSSDSPVAVEIAETEAEPVLLNTREVLRALEAAYPRMYADAGVGGSAVLRFALDTAGTADMQTVQVIRASHPEFAAAALQVLEVARFQPVMYKGEVVRVWITVPFTFQPPIRAARGVSSATIPAASAYRAAEAEYNAAIREYDAALMRARAPLPRARAEQVRQGAVAVREQRSEVQQRAEVVRRQANVVRQQSEQLREQSEAMRVRAEAMRSRSEEMRRTGEQMRQLLRQHHPELLRTGTGNGQYAYLLIDARGRVVKSGMHPLTRTPSRLAAEDSWDTETVQREVAATFPNLQMDSVRILRTRAENNQHLNVAYIVLKPDSPMP